MDKEYIVQTSSITAIANAIRAKTNTADGMTLEEMPEKIDKLKGTLNLAEINVTFSDMGESVTYDPDECDGIGKVNVIGDDKLIPENIVKDVTIFGVTGTYVPNAIKLTNITDTITDNGDYSYITPRGSDGIKRLDINVDVPVNVTTVDANLQTKTADLKAGGTIVKPDSGYDGLEKVYINRIDKLIPENIVKDVTILDVTGTYEGTVDANLESRINVIPSRSGQLIEPDEKMGYNGLSSVYVYGDSNLKPEYILKDKTIFNVRGTYEKTEIVNAELQKKTVEPTVSGRTFRPDSGYNGFSEVTVKGIANLTADKIAKGETILGITGEYVSPMCVANVIPSLDSQVITPLGFEGFSVINVAPAEFVGDATEAYAAGVASRDEEVAILNATIAEHLARIAELQGECENQYQEGYNVGLEAGRMEFIASCKDLDEVKY